MFRLASDDEYTTCQVMPHSVNFYRGLSCEAFYRTQEMGEEKERKEIHITIQGVAQKKQEFVIKCF